MRVPVKQLVAAIATPAALGALAAGALAALAPRAAPPAPAYAASSQAGACHGLSPARMRLARSGRDSARLSWGAPVAAAGATATYRVLRAGRTVGQTAARSLQLKVTPGKRTLFTVQARLGGVSCSASVRLTPRWLAPGRVRGLRVLALTPTGVKLAWRRASGGDAPVAGYRLLRDGRVVAQTHGRAYLIRLSPGRAHTVSVAAVDTRGHAGPAARAIRVGANPAVKAGAAPSVPGALSVAEVSENGASVWWLASTPGSAPVSGYRVYRDGRSVGQTVQTSMRLGHLVAGHTYSVTVAAVDGAGHQSAQTAPLRLTTAHPAPQAPPALAAVSVGDTSATLSWQAGAANTGTLVGYLLFENGQPVTVVHGQSVTLRLASGRTYSFVVRTLDSGGYLSAPSPALSVTTTHTPPSAPANLSATHVTSSSATVSWSASAAVSGNIVGYRVFRDGVPVGQTGETQMTLAQLAPSSEYAVTVAAVDSLGAVSASSAPLTLHTAEPPPSTGDVQAGLLASTDQSFADLQAHYMQMHVVYPTYFDCGAAGQVAGGDDPLVTGWAQARKIEVMPRVNCQNVHYEEEILGQPALRSHFIAALAALCREHGYQGVQIDFEGAPPSDREPFTQFITALAGTLHGQGEKLSTVVTAKTYNVMTGRAAMYDDAALSAPSDYIFVLDWGIHWTTSTPGSIDEWGWFKQVAEYAATMPNLGKFVLGMPMYGIDWPGGGGSGNPGTPLEFQNITALAASVGVTPEWSSSTLDPHFAYTDSWGVHHDVWYTDRQSIEPRAALARSLGIKVGLWHLGSEDQALWELPTLNGG